MALVAKEHYMHSYKDTDKENQKGRFKASFKMSVNPFILDTYVQYKTCASS